MVHRVRKRNQNGARRATAELGGCPPPRQKKRPHRVSGAAGAGVAPAETAARRVTAAGEVERAYMKLSANMLSAQVNMSW